MYDSLGSVAEVVRAVLRRRLTDLISQPASLTIPGDISVSRGANIKALQDRIAEVDAYYGVGGALARVIPPPERRAR